MQGPSSEKGAIVWPGVKIQTSPLKVAGKSVDAHFTALHCRSARDVQYPLGNIDPIAAQLIAVVYRAVA